MATQCNNLVCEGTAQAIKTANPAELLSFTLTGLLADATVQVNLAALGLWRTARLAYFTTNLDDPDGLQIELFISGIKQGGPWLGGELMPTNANACAIFNCKEGHCMGPIESAFIRITNKTGATITEAGRTAVMRIVYDYDCEGEGIPPMSKHEPACECEVEDEDPAQGTGYVPVMVPEHMAQWLMKLGAK